MNISSTTRKLVRLQNTIRIIAGKLTSNLRTMNLKNFYREILVASLIVCILGIPFVFSSLMSSVTIRSNGRIATPTIAPKAYKSQIRGVFVHSMSFDNPDWNLIMQTLANNGINLVVIENLDSRVISPYTEEIDRMKAASAAARTYGLKFGVSMNVLITPRDTMPEIWAVDETGSPTPWTCPTKQATRDYIRDIVETVLAQTKDDVDQFMFDYIRYDSDEMCYCKECEAKFRADTGLNDAVFPQDVTGGPPEGRYREQFMEWRIKPITELVRDIRNWILAIKQDMEFSIASWTLFQDSSTYWRYWLGQDTADYVGKGYIDLVAPMMYDDDVAVNEDYARTDLKYMTGGPQGLVPLIAFLDTCVDGNTPPSVFKARVDKIREVGCDGWIIWRYGGPGDGAGSGAPDIRDYLSILDMPPVLSLGDVVVSPEPTQALITWTTDLPATGKVEFSTSPLFVASFKYNPNVDFNYWDIDHVLGTIVEDVTPVTDHSVMLTGLSPGTKYYYRVQGQDASGIATSKVLTFTTP